MNSLSPLDIGTLVAWVVLVLIADLGLLVLQKKLRHKSTYVFAFALSFALTIALAPTVVLYLRLHHFLWTPVIVCSTLGVAMGIPVGSYRWDRREDQRLSADAQPNKRLEPPRRMIRE